MSSMELDDVTLDQVGDDEIDRWRNTLTPVEQDKWWRNIFTVFMVTQYIDHVMKTQYIDHVMVTQYNLSCYGDAIYFHVMMT